MSAITTHVLDTSQGKPAEGIRVVLEKEAGKDQWIVIAEGRTDSDGRANKLLPQATSAAAGIYRLTFFTASYFKGTAGGSLYPYVQVVFETKEVQHLHVPLLLNPFGYTTYRGS